MASVKSVPFGPFVRGVDASTGTLTQPKGSIPRGSNLLLSKRGSLRTCDGSLLVNAYNGVATAGRGKAMCEFFYAPTGVAAYYLRVMKALDQHLGAPKNLVAALSTSVGTLVVGQPYYWVVTALDGAGGETTISNEVTATPTSGHQTVNLTWNPVPNATSYNVYRGTASGGETLLVGVGLPVGSNGYADSGVLTPGVAEAVVSITVISVRQTHPPSQNFIFTASIVFTDPVADSFSAAQTIVYTAGSDSNFDGIVWKISAITSPYSLTATTILGVFTSPIHLNEQSTGGTALIDILPPTVDTTQQTALYAMPPAALGVPYTDADIVALFPADPKGLDGGGGGGGGGGSGGDQGGSGGQQGSTPAGGILGNVSFIPQIVQFTNQAVIALGNGFAPQVYSDPNGTPTNPATSVPISAISVDADGVVTITTSLPHNLSPAPQVASYPSWAPSTNYNAGDIVEPSPPNGFFYTAQNTARSSGVQTPNWNTTVGGLTVDLGFFTELIWVNSGAISFTPSVQSVGANVRVSGVSSTPYNDNGNGANAFVVIAIPSTTQVKVVNLNAIGQGTSSGGTLTVSTIPVVSTFRPSFQVWTASVLYALNSIVEPTSDNGFYYKAIQGGTSGSSEPSFPTGVGANVTDNGVIWQNAGPLDSAAPPPPGCAHVAVYAGSVWMLNTAPSNTGTGLDGPCSLRMSDVNNLKSWNPINQAFLDKDDGTEGSGISAFTISAQGIPPEGSLCAFKRKSVYQIIGVFGATDFAIQRVQSDMGIIAPRTLLFVPGFGLMRLTYMGFAVFDGVNDRVVSTQVAPYLVGSNDPDCADIVPMDQQWQAVSQAALTSNPPMYCAAIPVGTPGSSNGALTEIMCFDLVLKAWSVVNLPFSISTMLGVVTVSTIPITLFGSFDDGTLQRWQGGDLTWATAGKIDWSMVPPTCASKDADERLYLRRITVVGQQTPAAPSTMVIEPRNGGVVFSRQSIAMPSSGDFQVQAAGGSTGRRFNAIVSGSGLVTIDSVSYHIQPRPVGVLSGAIS